VKALVANICAKNKTDFVAAVVGNFIICQKVVDRKFLKSLLIDVLALCFLPRFILISNFLH